MSTMWKPQVGPSGSPNWGRLSAAPPLWAALSQLAPSPVWQRVVYSPSMWTHGVGAMGSPRLSWEVGT